MSETPFNPAQSGPGTERPEVEKGILTLRNCVALFAAVMAPVLAVSPSAPAGGAEGEASPPFTFILAFAATMFVGNIAIEFAKKLPEPEKL